MDPWVDRLGSQVGWHGAAEWARGGLDPDHARSVSSSTVSMEDATTWMGAPIPPGRASDGAKKNHG